MKGKSNIKCICMILVTFGCVLSSCAFPDKSADDMGGYSGILPGDNLQAETESVAEQKTTDSEPAETVETPNAENETFIKGEIDNSFSCYGTWEVKDYQSAEFSILTADEMESFRGIKITYQSDSILLDGEKVSDSNFIYETKDTTYNYDSLTEAYEANLGEWWNNISEVTCITVNSNESFFGNQFFIVDSDTIWIYYEGVFFLAKNNSGTN